MAWGEGRGEPRAGGPSYLELFHPVTDSNLQPSQTNQYYHIYPWQKPKVTVISEPIYVTIIKKAKSQIPTLQNFLHFDSGVFVSTLMPFVSSVACVNVHHTQVQLLYRELQNERTRKQTNKQTNKGQNNNNNNNNNNNSSCSPVNTFFN